MSITRAEVEKVSLLARLLLSDDELQRLTAHMSGILDYMKLLVEVDTDGVEPMAHALDLTDVFRLDEVRPSLPRHEALANSARHDPECYRVPAVLGDL